MHNAIYTDTRAAFERTLVVAQGERAYGETFQIIRSAWRI